MKPSLAPRHGGRTEKALPIALLALAISAFGIGTTEFMMMGLLPEISAAFGVSIPTAGYLISAYALGVVVGAPLLTATAARLCRWSVLLGLMAVFTAGNLLAAVAPSYRMLLAARVLTGLPHGAFFGIGSVVAAGMVPGDKRATAISMMFAGLTVANVLGVPCGTLLSQHVGWRSTFWLIAAIGVVSVVAIALLVPRQPRSTSAALGSELAAFRRPQVWLALGVGTFGFGGIFATYSYIEPIMTKVAGYSPTSVDWLFALYGVGMTVGNLVGGRLADRALMPSLYGCLSALGLVLALFVLTAHDQVTAAMTIFLIGVAGMACVPIVQTRIMDKAAGAPTLAAAANQSAFNLANAGGAFLGGLVINAGLGWTSPTWVGAILAAIGLGFAVASGALDRRGEGCGSSTRSQPFSLAELYEPRDRSTPKLGSNANFEKSPPRS